MDDFAVSASVQYTINLCVNSLFECNVVNNYYYQQKLAYFSAIVLEVHWPTVEI